MLVSTIISNNPAIIPNGIFNLANLWFYMFLDAFKLQLADKALITQISMSFS